MLKGNIDVEGHPFRWMQAHECNPVEAVPVAEVPAHQWFAGHITEELKLFWAEFLLETSGFFTRFNGAAGVRFPLQLHVSNR